MRKIRFGITGSGYMARTHGEAVCRLPHAATLVAIAGGSRAPGLAQRLGSAFEQTVESLICRPDIDAIIITTPHHLHSRDALLALGAGKHVLIEKPIATAVEDCDRMIDAAARRSLVIATGYNLRFRNNPPKARELIAANAIGRVLSLHFSMIRSLDENLGDTKFAWMNLPESVGNIIDALPHGIDLMRWLTGAEVKSVAAFCRTFLPDRPIEDTTVGIIELTNGAICSVAATTAAAGPYPREEARLSIVGSRGSLDLDCFGDLHLATRDQGWQLITTQPKVDYADPDRAFTADGRMKAFIDQLQSFIDGIDGKPMVAGTGLDGRAGVAASLAMISSSQGNRIVQLPTLNQQ